MVGLGYISTNQRDQVEKLVAVEDAAAGAGAPVEFKKQAILSLAY